MSRIRPRLFIEVRVSGFRGPSTRRRISTGLAHGLLMSALRDASGDLWFATTQGPVQADSHPHPPPAIPQCGLRICASDAIAIQLWDGIQDYLDGHTDDTLRLLRRGRIRLPGRRISRGAGPGQ